MSAIGASLFSLLLAVGGLLMGAASCTAKSERDPIVNGPVAGPTSTARPLVVESPENGPRSSSEPDVPFDGGKPEALGTAQPDPKATTSGKTVSDNSVGAGFDIYRELWAGSQQCAEEKP